MSLNAAAIDVAIPAILPLGLVLAHFIGDFLLQSDWMALNKGKNWKALAWHVLVYSACFLPWGWQFAVMTAILHFITDALTSRWTTKLWFFRQAFPDVNEWFYIPGKRHWFFTVIGFDQLIHMASLALVWGSIYG